MGVGEWGAGWVENPTWWCKKPFREQTKRNETRRAKVPKSEAGKLCGNLSFF